MSATHMGNRSSRPLRFIAKSYFRQLVPLRSTIASKLYFPMLITSL